MTRHREPAARRQLRRAIVLLAGGGVVGYGLVVPGGWFWVGAYVVAVLVSGGTVRRMPRPSPVAEGAVGVGLAIGLAIELWRTNSLVLAPGNLLAVVQGLLAPRAVGPAHRWSVAGGVAGHLLAAALWPMSGATASSFITLLLVVMVLAAWALTVAHRAAVARRWEDDGSAGAAARLARAGAGRGSLAGACWITASALLLASATFVLTPRPSAADRGRWMGAGRRAGLPTGFPPRGGKAQITGEGGRNVSGFRDRIDFAGMGAIKQDARIALRVRNVDAAGAPQFPLDGLLLRGMALNHYANARWTAAGVASRRFTDLQDGAEDGRTAVAVPPPGARFWRQRIEPVTLRAPFCFHTGQLLAAEASEVTVDENGTAALPAAPEQPFHVWSLPHRPGSAALDRARVTRSPEFVQIPWASTSARVFLVRLRTTIAGDETRPYRLARNLERGLRRRFKYTLSVPAPKPGSEPLAAFMRGEHAGHCEYFASTMVLLLRSAGIPCRLAGGFRCNEFDAARSEYIVRHRNAHAWVEVRFDGLGWVSFDPTPADDTAGGPVQITPPPQPGAEMDIALDARGFFDRLLAFDADERAALLARSGGWWGVLLVAGLAGLLGLLGLRSWQRYSPAPARRDRSAGAPAPAAAGRRTSPAFYLALQRTLAGAGFHRRRSGTARELAFAVRQGAGPAPRAVDKVIRTFEAVRYGKRGLTADAEARLHRLLDEVAAAAAARP